MRDQAQRVAVRAHGSLKVGDPVTAYNPTTGHAEPQTVQQSGSTTTTPCST
jgi:hypothetical protein